MNDTLFKLSQWIKIAKKNTYMRIFERENNAANRLIFKESLAVELPVVASATEVLV